MINTIKYMALFAMAISSCASPQPKPIALMSVSISADTDEAAPTECPEWVPLDGTIDGSDAFLETITLCKGPVMVEINSPGGNIWSALEIQKAIERHPYQVYCTVDGIALSAAFVTLQSCDVRFMTDRSALMMHHASVRSTGGMSHELQNMADALKRLDEGMVRHCAARMGKKPEDVEARIFNGREWWMSAKEAKEQNAIDSEVKDLEDAIGIMKANAEQK